LRKLFFASLNGIEVVVFIFSSFITAISAGVLWGGLSLF
jgi:hypothetical protein